ncbi:SGNH/GDSL hydrolase family protein [Methylophilus sp. Leaf414]|uniref:SGNH/GDSL hydrolase family protein n=1 Tax=Methylophilus sp. Leaf414 TaxID=1736371 RepID=UPI0006FB0898|nr:SGNH/GDSL hydrolase family protein [Methylophilus sp. Leaf414]KQT37684.1 hypothetical protein ASG24_01425 [Methylophilus sp. Leaf414]
MTVRFTKAWNGNSEGQIVSALSTQEEDRLINLGFATRDLYGTGGLPPLSGAIKSVLSDVQKTNANIIGVAGVGNGKIYDENNQEIKLNVNTIKACISKSFPSAGSNISSFISETSSFTGTTYIKRKVSGRPNKVRFYVTHKFIRSGDAYSQSGNQVTVNTTYTKGFVAGDLIYAFPTSGAALEGWYPVASVVDGTSVTYTAEDSQTTSGSMSWSKGVKGLKIAVALTEVTANDTSDNLYTPKVGGVSYNSAATQGSPYGWRTVDFNSAPGQKTNKCTAAKVRATSNVECALDKPSAWLSLPTVTPDDNGNANILMRIYHDATVSGSRGATSGIDMIRMNNSLLRSTLGLDASPYFRPEFQTLKTTADGIGDFTNLPTTLYAGTGFYIAAEYGYDSSVDPVGVMVATDSTGAHNKYMFDYGPSNAVQCNITGTTMTLLADITSTVGGAPSPYPISPGQPLTFSGQASHADNNTVFVTSLASGQNGKSGAVYNLSVNQSTLNNISVTVGVNSIQGWTSWANKAVFQKSTVAKPYTIYNGGMAAHRTHEYLGQVISALKAGVVPTKLFLQGYSINNTGTPTGFDTLIVQQQLMDCIDLAFKVGVKDVYVTTWPLTGSLAGNPTYKAVIDAHNAWIQNLAVTKVITGAPDIEQIRIDMGTNAFYSPDGDPANVGFGDLIHFGRAASDNIAALISNYL